MSSGAFLFGTIRPDLFYGCYFSPHLPQTKFTYLDKLLTVYIEKAVHEHNFGLSQQIRLGIICHYLSDFFCYPHNSHYTENLIGHHRYEEKLWHMMLQGDCQPVLILAETAQTPEELISGVHKLHEKYIQQTSDPQRDLTYAANAFIYIVSAVNEMAKETHTGFVSSSANAVA